MDEEAKSEAWIRKKPKRIIHNQTAIKLLMGLPGVGAILSAVALLWLIETQPFMVPAILVAWLTCSTVYVCGKTYVWNEERIARKKDSE